MYSLGIFDNLPNELIERIDAIIHKQRMKPIFEIINKYIVSEKVTPKRFSGYGLEHYAPYHQMRLCHKNNEIFFCENTMMERKCISDLLMNGYRNVT